MYLFSVEVRISQERSLWASKGHHRQGDRNRDIDANLANVNVLSELSSSGSISGEDGSTIAIAIAVDQLNGLIQGVNIDLNKKI